MKPAFYLAPERLGRPPERIAVPRTRGPPATREGMVYRLIMTARPSPRPRLPAALLPLLGALAGCPAPQAPPASAPGGAAPTRSELNVDNLLRGGRLRELDRRIGQAQGQAEAEAPEVVGLLLAARGRTDEGLRLLAKANSRSADRTGLCLPLLVAQIQLYQRGDAQAAIAALGQSGGKACAGPAAQLITALRARLVSLLGAPALQVAGPAGEQIFALDRVSASAGYLVTRVIFDRDKSGLFLLGTGFSDVVLDQRLLGQLKLRPETERRTPAAALPGLRELPGLGEAQLTSATVPLVRLGLLNLRNVPALVADLEKVQELFRKTISRDVRIDGLLPLQRLAAPRGYLRVRQRGAEVRVALSGAAAGPCRLQHPGQAGLYQLGGALYTEAGLPGSPPLLLQLALERRRSALRQSALKYAEPPPRVEPGEADLARPPITEPFTRERVAGAQLALGGTQLLLRHLQLLPSEGPTEHPADHGALGGDMAAELDLMIDLGAGELYTAPHDRASCQ